MRIPALVTVLALACGGAVAGGSHAAPDKDGKRHSSAAAAGDHQSKRSGDGIVDKTKRTFQRMGEKMGTITRTGSPNEREHDQAMRNDTRRMGAAGSDAQDSSRRQRMDEAYDNWQSQHKKQDR
jgi:hypothetical protein